MTKDGSNVRKRAAGGLAAAEQITYTEALRRTGQRIPPAGQEGIAATGAARVTESVATPTTDVVLFGHTGPVTFVALPPGRAHRGQRRRRHRPPVRPGYPASHHRPHQ